VMALAQRWQGALVQTQMLIVCVAVSNAFAVALVARRYGADLL
jgi:hypothetical protein